MADIHTYRPSASSLSKGQVLCRPYSFEEGRTILREMVESLSFDLLEKRAVCDRISLYIGYATPKSQTKARSPTIFVGEHGTQNMAREPNLCVTGSRKLPEQTGSFSLLFSHFDTLYRTIADKERTIKRLNIGVGNLIPGRAAHLARSSTAASVKRKNATYKAQSWTSNIGTAKTR